MGRFGFLAAVPLLLGGCYLVRQAQGQARILLGSRPIEAMLVDPSVPAATKAKLRLVAEIKDFGEKAMGLSRSGNYTSFFDTEGRPVTWIVSACRKDRFQPYTWWFPIVGEVPYKGFFSPEDALVEARELLAEGYDVSLRPVGAYSTLGYFPDPVLSTMLDDPEEELVALILHELTHGTLYLPGGTDFNEGLASFVGWQGALEFARGRYGTDSPEYGDTVRAFGREERRDAEAKELFRRLHDLYASDTPLERKLELRELVASGLADERRRRARAARSELSALSASGAGELEILVAKERLELHLPIGDRRVNNAEILMQRRYGRYEQFRAAFDKAGGDWRRFFAALRATSRPGPTAGP